jgi:hypothetical protein
LDFPSRWRFRYLPALDNDTPAAELIARPVALAPSIAARTTGAPAPGGVTRRHPLDCALTASFFARAVPQFPQILVEHHLVRVIGQGDIR